MNNPHPELSPEWFQWNRERLFPTSDAKLWKLLTGQPIPKYTVRDRLKKKVKR